MVFPYLFSDILSSHTLIFTFPHLFIFPVHFISNNAVYFTTRHSVIFSSAQFIFICAQFILFSAELILFPASFILHSSRVILRLCASILSRYGLILSPSQHILHTFA